MNKSYKFRLYPNAEQERLIQRTFGCCRFVYNHYLSKRIEAYKNAKTTMSYYTCCKDLTGLKIENPWLKDVDVTALRSSLRNLDDAYQNFFHRIGKGSNPGFPTFKSKKNNRKSYETKNTRNSQDTICLVGKNIKLPKLGLVRCAISRQVEGRILSATISQNPSGRYFASVCCTDIKVQQCELTGATVGIDLGLKDFAITSDYIIYPNHKHLEKSQKKLAKAQRELSRKTIDSANWDKARIKVARRHEQVANQRSDALHKLSTQFVKDYDVICIEDLQVKNMVKNHSLAKSINDASWGEFIRQLAYKCEWQDKILIKVDRFFPSSQLCNICGFKNAGVKDLSVRKWECPQCGAIHDRDINAAKNILHEGMRSLSA